MPTQREWTTIREYDDILFDYYNGIARITINRERYRNAFTPTTTAEMSDALRICREEADIDVIVITGATPNQYNRTLVPPLFQMHDKQYL